MYNRFYINESKATLLLFAQRDRNCVFSQVPSELISIIMNAPVTEFDVALEDAAFGRLETLKNKLDKNPQFVLIRGNVITPGGLEVDNTTLLECAIGGGDPDMVAMIKPYFSNIAGGEEALEKQLERYRPCVDAMQTQIPYNLQELIQIIIESAHEDVKAALAKKFNPEIKLHQALNEFRNAVQPKRVIKPQMHYNYQMLIHAFECYADEWNNLFKLSQSNYDRCDLVWRQVIGYLQRSLPAVERFVFARGLQGLIGYDAELIRNMKYKYGNNSYPDFSEGRGADLSGLGFDYGLYVGGERLSAKGSDWRDMGGAVWMLERLCQQKILRLQNLCSSTDLINRPSV